MAPASAVEEARTPLLAASEPVPTSSTGAGAAENGACLFADGATETQNDVQSVQRKLIIALVLALVFMVVEVVGGVIANSLAIMTDAAHLLSDVSGFGVAIFAGIYAAKKSQSTHTFGYHRVEVLGALASVLSTWLVTGILLYEAVFRIISPVPVNGKVMFILAMIGIAINVVLFWILGGHGHSHAGHSHSHGGHDHKDHAHKDVEAGHAHDHDNEHEHGGHSHGSEEESINLRGAVIHVLGDLVQSLGVAAAGALIWWKQDDPRWALADPICTFLFAGLVIMTTFSILRDISDILMERVPRAHNADVIQAGLQSIPGVLSVHDLHVWALKPGVPLLATHLNIAVETDACEILSRATAYCRSVGIAHSTIQLLHNAKPCCVISSTEQSSS